MSNQGNISNKIDDLLNEWGVVDLFDHRDPKINKAQYKAFKQSILSLLEVEVRKAKELKEAETMLHATEFIWGYLGCKSKNKTLALLAEKHADFTSRVKSLSQEKEKE